MQNRYEMSVTTKGAMINLKLTHKNASRLLDCLTRLQQLSPNDADEAQFLSDLLQQALLDATQVQHCPICNAPFAQDKVGRTGCYCSSACKQKAYRLRVNQRKRQYGPPKRA